MSSRSSSSTRRTVKDAAAKLKGGAMQDATGSGDEVQKKKVEEEEDEDDDEDDEEALVPLAEMKLAKFELLPSTLLHQEFLHVRKEKGAVAVPVCTNETPEEDRLDDLGGDPNAAAAEGTYSSFKTV